MAYGQLRFLYNNFLTQDMITPSTQATGRISGTTKTGSGVALLSVTGSFAGKFDLLYTLEIDSVAGGSDVGQATFRWRTSDTTSGQWEETGVLTRTTPAYALSADGLGSALSVAHTGQTGVDCVVGDVWQWDARATYGRERLVDLNRMTEWRSTGDTSENLVIDLGSAQSVTAFVLHDHNLTDGATLTLQANTINAWGSPAYSQSVTIQDPAYLYLSQSYRYWRIVFADASNPDGYISAANIFLGSYSTLENVNAWWGSSRQDGYITQRNQSEAGVMRRYAYARQRKLTLQFGNTISANDITSFLAMQDALINTTTHRVSPLWVHNFYDEADTLRLMEWSNLEDWTFDYLAYLRNSGGTMTLDEVVRV